MEEELYKSKEEAKEEEKREEYKGEEREESTIHRQQG